MDPRQPLAALLPRLPEAHEALPDDAPVALTLVLTEAGVDARGTVEAWLAGHGFQVEAWKHASRRLQVRGPAAGARTAFGLAWRTLSEGHRAAAGEPSVPAELAPLVRGLLGLDSRPRLRPHLRAQAFAEATAETGATQGQGSTVADFMARYAFPPGDGAGQRVGLLQLGGAVEPAELQTAFAALGLPVPDLRVVPVSGGDPAPSQSARWEVALDVQVLGAVVPKAALTVYIAPNSADGLLDLVEAALAGGPDQPTVLSMSWGAAEADWGALELELVADALQKAGELGVSVLVSSGDEGSLDGRADGKQHVNFPASCPWVTAVGGTQRAGDQEVVWNALAEQKGATGGGVSDFFDLPDWQKAAGVPPSANDGQVRRGVPDLAAHAAEAGGYRVFVDGQWRVLGGTSGAAPLLAGLVARINAARAKDGKGPLGFLNPVLYGSARSALRPVTEGDNPAYRATEGYSACTGLGVPDGAALLKALS
ncbi:MAG TPA: S53 family peptidase [Holophagaceae bacterium]|nr:S53 family peptidase [Holophagaceae bacterium]